MPTSLFAELFATLDIVVMERQQSGTFTLLGPSPDWFKHYSPDATPGQQGLRPGDWFLFLENFLIDADIFWQTQSTGQVKSGPWGERDRFGQEHFLEASAVCMGERKILLLACPEGEYEEKRSIIQKARDNKLVHGRFNKEQQQKEVLLHCIVHDLAGPLTALIMGLALLKTEALSITGRNILETCLLQSTKQQDLIRQILDIFVAEMGALAAPVTDPDLAPDIVHAAHNVCAALQILCLRKQVTLRLDYPADSPADWRVAGEMSRLERVIFNLLENALRHSPPQSVLTLSLAREEAAIVMTVDDEGPGVPPELLDTMFEKFSQAREQTGKIGLGLYFCRLTVEGWGGSIGYTPRPTGGARFWCRLPRFTTQPS